MTNRSPIGLGVSYENRVVRRVVVGFAVVLSADFSSFRCFLRSLRFFFLSLVGVSVTVVYSKVVGTSVVVGSSVGCGAVIDIRLG